MINRHHIIRLYIAVAVISLLASCTGKHKYTIGVSQCSEDDWRAKMNNEILREAMMYDDLKMVEIKSANDNSRQQIRDIQNFIDREFDLLIISPNEASSLQPVIERAYDQGIPVILVDRQIYSQKYTAYIGADNKEIGKSAGQYVADFIRDSLRLSPSDTSHPGIIAEIAGLKGSTPANERHEGFTKVFSGANASWIATTEYGDWTEQSGKLIMQSILHNHPNVRMVYCQNDRMASGAIKAAHKAGRNDIRFIGTDALSGKGQGLDMIIQHKLKASILYPTEGAKVLATAMNILLHQPYKKKVLVNSTVIDDRNASLMLLDAQKIDELNLSVDNRNGQIKVYSKRFDTQRMQLYFLIILIMLLVGFAIIVTKILRARTRLNTKLNKQKQQLEQQRDKLIALQKELEEATNSKLIFYTNISHDLRTPLSLIVDPVRRLAADTTLDDEQHATLTIIQRNVSILMNLINQLLDFRKLENGKETLNPSVLTPGNTYFKDWVETFIPAMRSKNIHYEYHKNLLCEEDKPYMLDLNKARAIIFNLLSNAIKYTPENGTITITSVKTDKYIETKIFNSGSYIPPEQREKIFSRFYQADNRRGGSGIGLALAHAYIELMGGKIYAESEEGVGTTFTFRFPLIEPDSSITTDIPADTTYSADMIPLTYELKDFQPKDFNIDKPSMLIIDDNNDIRAYLSQTFGHEYSILEAPDGNIGLQIATKYVPDIIICDVMMPVMDGIDCCRHLKHDERTCHIPVIMLTAKSQEQNRIESYDTGADAYITKPFSTELLKARVRNLLEGRKRLEHIFKRKDSEDMDKEAVSDIDKEFLKKFFSIIRGKLSNCDLNVEEIGREIGYSRVQLYRKIKALTNYSPVELLRIERLKKADSMLHSTDEPISVICYSVGFSSPSYFTKCYKAQYGISPSEIQR